MIRKRLVYVKLNDLVDIETVIKSANGVAGVAWIEKLQGAQTPTSRPGIGSSWTIRPGDFGWSCLCSALAPS